MEVRALTEADAEAWLALRLRALREHPDAFVATPEETESLPDVKKRFATARGDETRASGAADPHLVGSERADHEASNASRRSEAHPHHRKTFIAIEHTRELQPRSD